MPTSFNLPPTDDETEYGIAMSALTFARDEAGKLDYFPQVVSVDEICKSSLSFIKSQALKKSVTVTYDEQISQVKYMLTQDGLNRSSSTCWLMPSNSHLKKGRWIYRSMKIWKKT